MGAGERGLPPRKPTTIKDPTKKNPPPTGDGRKDPLPPMPARIHILRDHKGNEMTVGSDLTAEQAIEKMGEGYDLQLFTYVLQPAKNITR